MKKDEVLRVFSKGFSQFLEREKIEPKKAAELLGVTDATISTIKSGKTLPRFDKVFNLVELGMRLEEIFGPELAEKLLEGLKPEPGLPDHLKTPEIKEVVAQALADIIAKGSKG